VLPQGLLIILLSKKYIYQTIYFSIAPFNFPAMIPLWVCFYLQ
jgi:hypothetical protein